MTAPAHLLEDAQVVALDATVRKDEAVAVHGIGENLTPRLVFFGADRQLIARCDLYRWQPAHPMHRQAVAVLTGYTGCSHAVLCAETFNTAAGAPGVDEMEPGDGAARFVAGDPFTSECVAVYATDSEHFAYCDRLFTYTVPRTVVWTNRRPEDHLCDGAHDEVMAWLALGVSKARDNEPPPPFLVRMAIDMVGADCWVADDHAGDLLVFTIAPKADEL